MSQVRDTLADSAVRALIADALDATLIVEAAAGTGKTTELVTRIVRILSEGRAEVGEIVAVTFTEKAAGELKLRLRERLDAERARAGHDRDRRARLDQSLTRLEEAHVNTIHGFCADLLRERPVEAGVDPLFDVLTEAQAKRLFDDAFGRWIQQQLVAPPEGVRRALRRSAFGGEDGPVDRLLGAAWDLAQWRDFPAPWTRNPFARAARIAALLATLRETADLTRRPASTNDPLFTGTEPARRLSDEIALRQTLGEAGERDLDEWEAALVDLSRDRTLANVKQGRGKFYRDGTARERVLAAVADLRAGLDEFRMDADADLAALLQQELRGALDEYQRLKARAGALDFLDLLLRARDLVRDNPMVRRGFQQRFKRIFVDEFQDTDPLQAEILLLLAADDPAETDWRRARLVPGRLFLVGDPKQSIYRFRRADVAIYRDVCRQLRDQGAMLVHLTTNFRSVPEVQACVNAAFAPAMTGDETTLQAAYVALSPHRPAIGGQPSIVALPVPEPYARRYVSGPAIEKSLPDAVGAMVEWIVRESGWKVTERSGSDPVPVAAKHVCLLFRRFVSWQTDVTRAYVEALESRGIPHVLVGGKAFHEREEVEALRAALTAIEWPEDELSVFATLRGPFFAIGDEALLEWAWRFGKKDDQRFVRGVFNPFRIPTEFLKDTPPDVEHLRPIASALQLLRDLHKYRNYLPPARRKEAAAAGIRLSGGVSGTLQELLTRTRAHVGFALRIGGEQALANVLHIGELARQYEANGGISFRGFVEELRIAADTAQASEAPILEEDSDGVRMMTVHKAKGLEFPIVILVDMTCRLSRVEAGRWIDPTGRLCALKLAGWAPTDLLLNGPLEAARDRAEGLRLAYVAATRARDVLIVPTIGDEVYDGGWIDPLMPAVYPPPSTRPDPAGAPGCPAFTSRDSVMNRPDGDPAQTDTVSPGLYQFQHPELPSSRASSPGTYSAVWWDPHVLALRADPGYGLRRDDLIAKDGDATAVAARLAAYDEWQAARAETIRRGSAPSIAVETATALATEHSGAAAIEQAPIEVISLSAVVGRPFGPAFGTLVHATLATVPLDAGETIVSATAATQARILPFDLPPEEVYAAAEVVSSALRHPLFERVRAAERRQRCHREWPVIWQAPSGVLVEGTIDLVFEEKGALIALDFKTDRELATDLDRYKRQLTYYCRALEAATGEPAHGVLLRV
jgi:ATP-dependent exoDNAse (exonuclease V) beta subunit